MFRNKGVKMGDRDHFIIQHSNSKDITTNNASFNKTQSDLLLQVANSFWLVNVAFS